METPRHEKILHEMDKILHETDTRFEEEEIVECSLHGLQHENVELNFPNHYVVLQQQAEVLS